MQRKATKNTRGPNADEKRFMAWVKEQPCICCGAPGPSIADHVRGSTFRHLKVLIGHWYLLPLCEQCDRVKTLGSINAFIERFGLPGHLWAQLAKRYGIAAVPPDVFRAILDWGR